MSHEHVILTGAELTVENLTGVSVYGPEHEKVGVVGDLLLSSDEMIRSAVIDVGCGSGLPIARGLVGRGFAVTGVDAAPEMLALFRANLPDAQAVLSDMRTLALGRRFAGLIAWDSLFHLTPADQRITLARLAAHAAPEAALLFTSGPAEGSAIGEFEGGPLYHGSLDPAEYRALLCAHGFDVVDHVAEDPRCGYRTVWLARRSA